MSATLKPTTEIEVLLQTECLYVAILDEGSPAYRPQFMTSLWEASKRRVALGGPETSTLQVFDTQLIEAAQAGELLAWTLLFDGVFRTVAHVVPGSARPRRASATPPEATAGELWSGSRAATLSCPTGRLMLSCLSKLGLAQQPFVVLEPGDYRVSVERNEQEEFNHTLLESPGDYPAGAGPDWRIAIQRVDVSS